MGERSVEATTDTAAVRHALQRDPIGAAYMLGDLDAAYADFCTWYAAALDGEIDAVLLVYTGLSAPVVLTWGEPEGIGAILGEFITKLPERAHIHLEPEHLPAIDQSFAVDKLRPMVRMGLAAAEFVPAADDPASPVSRLTHRDTGEIIELYQCYPDSFFEPSQLGTGHYYGIRRDGRLASVAGVHIFSRADHIAALGNIVTAPEFRGQGLSTRCTSHLCEQLIAEGTTRLALNVERQNASAVRVYEKLGFRENNIYLEGFLTRPLAYKIQRAG